MGPELHTVIRHRCKRRGLGGIVSDAVEMKEGAIIQRQLGIGTANPVGSNVIGQSCRTLEHKGDRGVPDEGDRVGDARKVVERGGGAVVWFMVGNGVIAEQHHHLLVVEEMVHEGDVLLMLDIEDVWTDMWQVGEDHIEDRNAIWSENALLYWNVPSKENSKSSLQLIVHKSGQERMLATSVDEQRGCIEVSVEDELQGDGGMIHECRSARMINVEGCLRAAEAALVTEGRRRGGNTRGGKHLEGPRNAEDIVPVVEIARDHAEQDQGG
ncbi:hypothetical protein C8Q76DRAFT_690324 [Earliella scabrosa]|nr:hypothetical protein C8Q76DRAFT_690324 [Earliella scabrosa]